MATKTCSILFPVRQCDLPDRALSLEDDSAESLLNNYGDSGYFSCLGSRGAYVESWITAHINAMPSLDYFTKVSATIGPADIPLVLRDIEIAFDIIRKVGDDEWHNGYWHPVSEALLAADSKLAELVSVDGDDPYNLIMYLREHRRVFSYALDSTGYAMYLSFNPYRPET